MGEPVSSTTEFVAAGSMQPDTHDPAPATTRVSGTPVGTPSPSVRQMPKSVFPCTICIGRSVSTYDQPDVSVLKPTLI